MENKQPSIVPGVLAVIGLVADAIGIYTFLKMGGSQSETAPPLFYPIFELILIYSGIVFSWYNLNRIGMTFTDFDSPEAPNAWKPMISPALFSVLTIPIQVIVFENVSFVIFFQAVICLFIGLASHLLYVWQHMKE